MHQHPHEILRMLDANLNRAREGLRVAEDCARFALEDATLTEACKTARHRLKAAIDSLNLPPDALIAARDTQSDVGTAIATASEADRAGGTRDLVAAACKRAQEALRVVEESAKALARPAAEFEAVRYRLYTIEKQLLLALRPPCPQWTLCVLVTESLCTHHSPAEIVKHAADAGADCIQIREKDMPDAPFLDHAAALTHLAHDLGLHVMINDRPHIVRLVGADGVHLGRDDLPTAAARSLLGPRFWIGRSCSTIDHAADAIDQGADTCGLGPVFPSTTKAKPTLAGLDLVRAYLARDRTRETPMLAISGIDENNIDHLAATGCPGVAVSSGICSAQNPRAAASAIVSALTPHDQNSAATIDA